MFRAWIEDYVASVKGKYHTEKDLPPSASSNLVFTERLLEASETPATWIDKNLRVDVHAWEQAHNGWATKPIATGERQVGSGRSTNLLMFRIVRTGSEQEKAARRGAGLEPGRYLLKYYVDIAGKSAQNYATPTDSAAFYQGQQEIASDWKPGWGSMTKVRVAVR